MSSHLRLLVVEDHQDIAEMIVDYMTAKGFSVDYAADGVTGLHLAVSNDFDAIVLDISLPGLNGLALCKQLREVAQKQTPIILLTARDTLDDKVLGFDAGADDYLVKPFAIKELEMRVRACLRRNNQPLTTRELRCADLCFKVDQKDVRRGSTRISLTPIGYQLLEKLMLASPAYVSRSELERTLWGDERPDSDALRSHIYALRKSLDRPFDDKLIQHSTAGGYRIAEPTT